MLSRVKKLLSFSVLICGVFFLPVPFASGEDYKNASRNSQISVTSKKPTLKKQKWVVYGTSFLGVGLGALAGSQIKGKAQNSSMWAGALIGGAAGFSLGTYWGITVVPQVGFFSDDSSALWITKNF